MKQRIRILSILQQQYPQVSLLYRIHSVNYGVENSGSNPMGDVTRGLIITDVRVQDTPFSAKKIYRKISTNECRIIKKKAFRLHLWARTVDTLASYLSEYSSGI